MRLSFVSALVGPLLLKSKRWSVWFGALLYAYFYLDGSESRGGRPSAAVFSVWCTISRWWHRTLKSCDLILENKGALMPSQQYIFALHPHGALPVSAIMQYASSKWDAEVPIPREQTRLLVAGFCFVMPGLRELYLGGGFVDASKFSAEVCLDAGRSLLVFPGGASEAMWCGPKEDSLVLKSRRGFIRLALQRGLPVVPCYTFGETDVLCPPGPVPGSALWSFQRAMQKVVGLNVDPGMPLLPRKDVPVSTVIGTPVMLPTLPDPTTEVVDHWLQVYMHALQTLHTKYEHCCNPECKPLLFLEEGQTAMP